jgi:hypothetical protein
MQVAVQQFRSGNRDADHWAQANLRIVNAGRVPLTLGYVDDRGQLLDENGNIYRVTRGGARGIGLINRSAVDTSFVLQPGESADARFESQWMRGPPNVTGLQFQRPLALRELAVQPGGRCGSVASICCAGRIWRTEPAQVLARLRPHWPQHHRLPRRSRPRWLLRLLVIYAPAAARARPAARSRPKSSASAPRRRPPTPTNCS